MNTNYPTQTPTNNNSKLVITLDGAVINEFVINKDSISIGRKLSNDIQLNELTVSGNHSVIKTSENKTYIKDMASTNGTLLNGVQISKSALKHGDIIQVGDYQFTYFAANDEYKPSMFIKAEFEESKNKINTPSPVKSSNMPLAGVRILNGPLKSKILDLRRPFNTIGFNGKKSAIIARNPDGYTISILKDKNFSSESDIPKINGTTLGEDFEKLNNHDVIELLDTQIEFFYYR
ncbi:MAG: FHA domain-containing protein [Thiohalomonadales bacterium]